MSRPTATVARHAAAYATGSVVGGISRAVLLPVIARTLAPSEYGVLSLLLAATNLLHLVFEAGLTQALIRFHHETGDVAERARPHFDASLRRNSCITKRRFSRLAVSSFSRLRFCRNVASVAIVTVPAPSARLAIVVVSAE